MGQLDVHIRHGGGGGRGWGIVVLAGAAMAVIGGGGGLASAASGLAAVLVSLLCWVAGVFGAVAVLGLAVFVLTRGRRAERDAAAASAREAIEERDRARELEQHQRKLEIAAASAPRIYNVIDPGALRAAAAVTVRGEVER